MLLLLLHLLIVIIIDEFLLTEMYSPEEVPLWTLQYPRFCAPGCDNPTAPASEEVMLVPEVDFSSRTFFFSP